MWAANGALAITFRTKLRSTFILSRKDVCERKGKALADFFKSLFKAFPDLRHEVISRGDAGGGLVASQFMLHATHTGPFFMDGSPATGRTIAYPVASFTQVEGDKIRSEHIYLDRQTVAEQLGLKPK